MSKKPKKGICYLVGAGPGDPGLMTLRGKECIEAADVLVYDYLSSPALLEWARPDAELIYAGKKAKKHAISQDEINALLVEKAKQGNVVTRLKGGDPLLFARGAEEAAKLVEAGIPFEFVPGISSTIAGPAYAGIPVTHRDHCSQLTIFTGHEDPRKSESSLDYEQIAKAPGTKIILMGVERLPLIVESMMEAGAEEDTPIALIRWATTGRQETITGTIGTISNIAENAGFAAPAVAILGGVVECRETLNWFENRPLRGKKIVVTRDRGVKRVASPDNCANSEQTSWNCPRFGSIAARARTPGSLPGPWPTPTATNGSSSRAPTGWNIFSKRFTRFGRTPARSADAASPR